MLAKPLPQMEPIFPQEVCEADTHSTKCTFTRLSLYQLTATTNYFEHVRCVTANNNDLKGI